MDNPLYLYDLEYKNVIGVDLGGRRIIKKHVEAIKTKGVLKNVHRKVFLRKILDETKDEPKEVQLRIL